MRKMLLVTFAILLAGCGKGADRDADRAEALPETDPRTHALGRRPAGMSAEFIEELVAKMETDYPPTGHDTWTLVDDVLSRGDNLSNDEFEKRFRHAVLKALAVKAENIFGAVCIGRDPPGTDDLKFVLTNRTGRAVSAISGVMHIRNKFGNTIESLKLSADKPIPPGGELVCPGHWSLPAKLLDQLSAQDERYKIVFVAARVTFADGTTEQFFRTPEDK
jgi:hypothetical protein